MSELLERELARVLRDLPGEPGVQPTLYAGVQGRAQQIRRRRYGSAVAAIVVAVVIAVLVPGALFTHSNTGAPRPPAGGSDISTWPARGSLTHNAALRRAAIDTWQQALDAAHRGRLFVVPNELYADVMPGVGTVVVLTGPEPHGGDRFVVLKGGSARNLEVYADVAAFDSPGLAVVFGTSPGSGAPCGVTGPVLTRPMLVLTPTGKHDVHWSTQPFCSPRQYANGQPDKAQPTHPVHLTDGLGTTTVTQRQGEMLNVDIDTNSRNFTPRTSLADRALPPGRLPGGQIATSVPLDTTPVPEPTINTRPNTGSLGIIGPPGAKVARSDSHAVAVSGGHAIVRPRPGQAPIQPNAIGWSQRTDDSASQSADLMFMTSGTQQMHALFPSHRGFGEIDDFIHLALPDGTLLFGQLLRPSGESARVQLAAFRGVDDASGCLDRALDPKQLPKELSAVVDGRHGNRWLFVAGAPGVASIDYRAKGSTHWQSMEVYESTGYLQLPASDKGDGVIRLRATNGTTVYQGKVDAPHGL